MKYIIFFIFIFLFILYIFFIGKKAKSYNLYKEYSICYRLVLTNPSSAYKCLTKLIKNVYEMNNQEYLTKLYILKLYIDLTNCTNYQETLSSIELIHLITKNNKFCPEVASKNGDSLYFIVVDMLRAYHLDKKDVIEDLFKKVTAQSEYLNKYVEYNLINAVYNTLTNSADKGSEFYNFLIENDQKSNYEKEILQIYRSTAIAMKKKIGYALSEDENTIYNEFKKTLLGSIVIKNLSNE